MEKAAIFCGSRECDGKEARALAFKIMTRFLREEDSSHIVIDGMARGADTVFHDASRVVRPSMGSSLMNSRFPANWEMEGKSAGYKRNVRMAEELEHYRSLGYEAYVIAMVPGNTITTGTQHMVNIAKSYGFTVCIFSVSTGKML